MNSNRNSDLITARKAVIGSLTNGIDTSGGAYFWDGADIVNNEHREWGFVYSDPGHDIYNTGNVLIPAVTTYCYDVPGRIIGVRGTYNHRLISTAAFGGTIFRRYDAGFINTAGNTPYP
jgi:hypothetical protein